MADLATVLKAAPIGLFMLVGSYVASRRRKSGWSRAVKEFPALAERLGVSYRAPSEQLRIGTLRGKFRGYEVFVDPDDRPRVVVYFTTAPALILRTFEHEKRVPSGMRRLETRNAVVDRLFKDRYAAPDVADAIVARGGELGARVEPFSSRWRARLAALSITSERVECELDFGRPLHLPPEVVEELVPAAVELARFLESMTSGGDGAHEPPGLPGPIPPGA